MYLIGRYPWGEEAFTKAREEDKVIFLSVGYSTCHWCHVMERESFENEEIARIMNDNFVNIKVDREERPDVDKIYMTYVQATTGGGGWPMSVWLTPDLKPILGGTYFPPKGNYGRPGFPGILGAVSDQWESNRQKLISSGEQVISALEEHENKPKVGGSYEDLFYQGSDFYINSLNNYSQTMKDRFDARYGGFGKSPKFPRPVEFTGLYTCFNRFQDNEILDMCEYTHSMMFQGGMHDAIGGGFHRYSVDKEWHVPHFEKMLYDQAQLANSYLTLFTLRDNPEYATAVTDILDYVIDCLLSPEHGFYSAEDADSLIEGTDEKSEGAFYVWEEEEIDSLLTKRNAQIFKNFYTVKPNGNVKSDPHNEFINKNVLIQIKEIEEIAMEHDCSVDEVEEILKESRSILYNARKSRPRPFLDDKIITSWNGLMISAFARASSILNREDYLEIAENAARFIKSDLYQDGVLIRNFRGEASIVHAFAQDYAFLITGLLDLYESSGNFEWLEWSVSLQNKMIELFYDTESAGFFATDGKDPSIVLRMKETYDGAEPSENSFAAMNLIRLGNMLQNEDYVNMARNTLFSQQENLLKAPMICPHSLAALDLLIYPPKQIIIAADINATETRNMIRKIFEKYHHFSIIYADNHEGQAFLRQSGVDNILQESMIKNNQPTAYVCQNFTCSLPTNSLTSLNTLLHN